MLSIAHASHLSPGDSSAAGRERRQLGCGGLPAGVPTGVPAAASSRGKTRLPVWASAKAPLFATPGPTTFPRPAGQEGDRHHLHDLEPLTELCIGIGAQVIRRQGGAPSINALDFVSGQRMAKSKGERTQLPTHGAAILPSVKVDSYNLEVEDEEGFLGDKANRGAFWEILDKWRKPLQEQDEDPLGAKPSDEIGKKKLAALLNEGEPEAAGLVQSAIEDFAQQLAHVIRRFLRLKAWRDTECIVIGGGFSGSRVGELAVGRTGLLLKADDIDVDLELIRRDPDEAGLLGAAHLLPAWMLKAHEGILAVDVGGTNIRAGVVELNLEKATDLAKARVVESKLWRHADEQVDRDEAVERLAGMLDAMLTWAVKNKLSLAPVIGIGCPGVIHEDGSITRGAQNLPGNWESSRFNLPRALAQAVPKIGDHETLLVMHNDAVVQGLSERPFVKDRTHWGVLTIGTGLGNARFTNRHPSKSKASKRN
jgi:predicted NBD/HSP70 family sugar kinase